MDTYLTILSFISIILNIYIHKVLIFSKDFGIYKNRMMKNIFFMIYILSIIILNYIYFYKGRIYELPSFIFFLNMLISIAIIDYTASLIYNRDILLFGTMIIFFRFLTKNLLLLELFKAVFLGIIFYYIVYFLGYSMYKREAFGKGDVLYLGAIGTFLNANQVLNVAIISFFVSGFFIIITKLFKLSRKKSSIHSFLKTEMPFAPFISISALIVYLFM